ncbi:MAG: hypothetical protein ACK5Q5_01510, partial [Planctomycetaceae bacterium]
MSIFPVFWRQGARLTAAFVCGALVLAGLNSGTSLGRADAIAIALLWLGLMIRSLRRQRQSLADMQAFVHSWSDVLESADLTAETAPDFDDLRWQLQATHRQLQAERRRLNQESATLMQDT